MDITNIFRLFIIALSFAFSSGRLKFVRGARFGDTWTSYNNIILIDIRTMGEGDCSSPPSGMTLIITTGIDLFTIWLYVCILNMPLRFVCLLIFGIPGGWDGSLQFIIVMKYCRCLRLPPLSNFNFILQLAIVLITEMSVKHTNLNYIVRNPTSYHSSAL